MNPLQILAIGLFFGIFLGAGAMAFIGLTIKGILTPFIKNKPQPDTPKRTATFKTIPKEYPDRTQEYFNQQL